MNLKKFNKNTMTWLINKARQAVYNNSFKWNNLKITDTFKISNFFFDIFFIFLAFWAIFISLHELYIFLWSQEWIFDKENFFKLWLEILIIVKFYNLMKDYVWSHHIEISKLLEIWIIAISSELIFEKIHEETIHYKLMILTALWIFYFIEKIFLLKEKKEKKSMFWFLKK